MSVLRVAPDGDFQAIQAGLESARYGDTVLVSPGVYREHLIPRSGVDLIGEPGAILDGSDPALEHPSWTANGDGTYSTQLPAPYFATNHNLPLLWRDSVLFYRYSRLSDAQSGVMHTPYWTGPIAEGWWAWTDGLLTVRSLSDPARHTWRICPWAEGVYCRQVDDVLIYGFTVRYFRFGVFAAGARGLVVEGNRLLTPFGIRSGDAPMTEVDFGDAPRSSSDCAAIGNTFSSPPAMTYQATKGTWQETAAISATGSRWTIAGNDVGLNHDGIQCDAADSLIENNVVHDLSDDGIEVDGEGRNVTIRGNSIVNTNNGVSMAPITVGPTRVYANRIAGFREQAYKYDPGDVARIQIYGNMVTTP